MENKEKTRTIRKIVMSVNREMLTFLVVNRKIYYTDRKLGLLIRLMPKPKNLVNMIYKSRNKLPMFLVKLFEFTEEELKEYDKAETVEDLVEIIIKDAKKNGCLLIANGDMEASEELVSKIESAEVVA